MAPMDETLSFLGKTLIVLGMGFIVPGAVFLLSGKLSWLGKLPGDIQIRRESFSFYFPIVTCLLISLLLSAILWLFSLLSRR
jgi:hypothetical protein